MNKKRNPQIHVRCTRAYREGVERVARGMGFLCVGDFVRHLIATSQRRPAVMDLRLPLAGPSDTFLAFSLGEEMVRKVNSWGREGDTLSGLIGGLIDAELEREPSVPPTASASRPS